MVVVLDKAVVVVAKTRRVAIRSLLGEYLLKSAMKPMVTNQTSYNTLLRTTFGVLGIFGGIGGTALGVE